MRVHVCACMRAGLWARVRLRLISPSLFSLYHFFFLISCLFSFDLTIILQPHPFHPPPSPLFNTVRCLSAVRTGQGQVHSVCDTCVTCLRGVCEGERECVRACVRACVLRAALTHGGKSDVKCSNLDALEVRERPRIAGEGMRQGRQERREGRACHGRRACLAALGPVLACVRACVRACVYAMTN